MAGTHDEPTDVTPEHGEKPAKPADDGPPEIDDAAEQELEYPADETDEG